MATNSIPALLFAAAAPADKTGPVVVTNTITTNTVSKDLFVASTNKVEPSDREILSNRLLFLRNEQKLRAWHFPRHVTTNQNQNISLIVGTAKKDDFAFALNLGIWFNDQQNPTLYELAENENTFLARHQEFIKNYGTNRVRTLQWSFHGMNGEGFAFMNKADTKPEEVFDHTDIALRNKLVEVLPKLLKKDGASIILDSCGDRDLNPTFILFIQSLLEDVVKESDLQHIRLFASRTPFSSGEKKLQLIRGEVKSLTFTEQPANTIDISIVKGADGTTSIIDNNPITISTYTKSLEQFRQERIKLKEDFDQYKTRLEAISKGAQKPAEGMHRELQNRFVANIDNLSRHLNLFADTLSKLSIMDFPEAKNDELKQLVKNIALDILSLRTLLAHEMNTALTRNYGLFTTTGALSDLVKKNAEKLNLKNDEELQGLLVQACPALSYTLSVENTDKVVGKLTQEAKLYVNETEDVTTLLNRSSTKEESSLAFKQAVDTANANYLKYYQELKNSRQYEALAVKQANGQPMQYIGYIELHIKSLTK